MFRHRFYVVDLSKPKSPRQWAVLLIVIAAVYSLLARALIDAPLRPDARLASRFAQSISVMQEHDGP